MAITITDRATHQSTAGGIINPMSKASSAISFGAGTLIVLGLIAQCRNNTGVANTITWSVTDTIADTGGGAWAQRASCTRGSVTNNQYAEDVQLWTRLVGTSPGSSKTVTPSGSFTTGGQNSTDDGWVTFHLWEVAGQDTSPIGLSVSPAPTTGSTVATNATGPAGPICRRNRRTACGDCSECSTVGSVML